jgi:hypothetical protein
MPGSYTVRLTVAGRRYERPLTVRMDPRVKTPAEGIARQWVLSKQLFDALKDDSAALAEVRSVRSQLRDRSAAATGQLGQTIAAFDARVAALEGSGGGFGGQGAGGTESFARLRGNMASLLDMLQDADVAPTTQLAAAVGERLRALEALRQSWRELRSTELAALNDQLRAARMAEVRIE